MKATRKLILSALIVLFGAAAGCPLHEFQQPKKIFNNQRRSTPATASRTAVENIHIFDGSQFTPPKTVCIDGGWIVDIDGCSNPTITVDGAGKFMIPGLIDSHLHLTDVQSLENFTSYGCTTAMHMNCQNYTQCHVNANQVGLASFNWAGMSAVGNGSAHEKTDPTRPRDTLIYPDTDVADFVSYQFNNGSDFMKITAEVCGPSTEQQIQMVDTTRNKYNKQSMTHASAISSYKQAVISNTDGIQHVPDDGILDNSTIKQILAQNQFVTPTLNVFEFAYRNPLLLSYFTVQAGSNRSLEHAQQNAKLLHQHGVPLIAGTDSVGTLNKDGQSTQVPWGLSLHFELQNFVNILGMTPAEALNAATKNAAKWHRVPDRGSIAVEKRADLVILNSNPLLNITNTLDIDRIWAFGVEVEYVAKVTNKTMSNPANDPDVQS
jgi:imidazolonepropionase-like amidohydrolase